MFKISILEMLNLRSRLLFQENLLINRLLTNVFALLNEIVLNPFMAGGNKKVTHT